MIETPAGQGTETCFKFAQFKNFIKRFKGDKRLGVCIDTQHVFAAGNDPLEYIQKWLEYSPETLQIDTF